MLAVAILGRKRSRDVFERLAKTEAGGA